MELIMLGKKPSYISNFAVASIALLTLGIGLWFVFFGIETKPTYFVTPIEMTEAAEKCGEHGGLKGVATAVKRGVHFHALCESGKVVVWEKS